WRCYAGAGDRQCGLEPAGGKGITLYGRVPNWPWEPLLARSTLLAILDQRRCDALTFLRPEHTPVDVSGKARVATTFQPAHCARLVALPLKVGWFEFGSEISRPCLPEVSQQAGREGLLPNRAGVSAAPTGSCVKIARSSG